MAPRHLWLCILGALFVLLSCGGEGRELANQQAPAKPRAAVTYTPAPQLETDSPSVAPDAWAEHVAHELAAERAFAERYPLHGIAFHVLAQVFSEPNERAVVIGYLRRGAVFRTAIGRQGRGCEQRWHELAAGGFVCAGRGFLLGESPQVFDPSPPPPALYAPLPYAYAKNIAHASLQYWTVPSREQEAAASKLLIAAPAQELRDAALANVQTAAETFVLPDFVRMPMEPGFYVSVDREVIDGERAFVRTVRGAFVPKAVLSDVTVQHAPGVVLPGQTALPLGIVYRGSARTYLRDPLRGTLQDAQPLAKFSSVALTGVREEGPRHALLLARDGSLIEDTRLRIIEHVKRPPLVPKHARFIHVSLASQTLVAYDGQVPVFATLVSTGKAGYETPQGLFRIQQKHVSATMDGLAGSDEAYSIEDVPWTMYFDGSYALHAAFWHDHFGNVRSHGCINLAPADARWLFRWVTPVLPSGFHGVVAQPGNQGTFIAIAP